MSRPLRFLVSAGPTREPLDRVRFLSNRSSGKLGFAVAAAAAAAGHAVALVSGPVALAPPAGVDYTPVETAREMQEALASRFAACDVLVMSAAVADFRPLLPHDGKIKKTGAPLTLELIPNPDILESLSSRRGRQIVIGFALEVEAGLESARRKLVRKRLDMIVLNGPENLDADSAAVTILTSGDLAVWPVTDKARLGERLVAEAVALWTARYGGSSP